MTVMNNNKEKKIAFKFLQAYKSKTLLHLQQSTVVKHDMKFEIQKIPLKKNQREFRKTKIARGLTSHHYSQKIIKYWPIDIRSDVLLL